MSSIITHLSGLKPVTTVAFKAIVNVSFTVAITLLALSAVGCSTTQEFKPTASVIVGGQKSI